MSHCSPNPGCCPMCGEANSCSLEAYPVDQAIANKNQDSCWCMSYQLSENARDLLKHKLAAKELSQQEAFDQNPQQLSAQSKSCLCQRCLTNIAQKA